MFAAAPLSPAQITEAGRLFVMPPPDLPWLAPACILAGMAVQLAVLALLRARGGALTVRRGLFCAAGACLVLAGAAADRDITVAVGQLMALAGIWVAWRAP